MVLSGNLPKYFFTLHVYCCFCMKIHMLILNKKLSQRFAILIVLVLLNFSVVLAGQRFSAVVKPLPKWVILKMKRHSWRIGCPIPLKDLSYIYLKHWDDNGKIQFGRLVVYKQLILLLCFCYTYVIF